MAEISKFRIKNWDQDKSLLVSKLAKQTSEGRDGRHVLFQTATKVSGGFVAYLDMGAFIAILPNGDIRIFDMDDMALSNPHSWAHGEGMAWLEHAFSRIKQQFPDLANWEMEEYSVE